MPSSTALTASIAGVVYPVKNTSLVLGDKVDQRSTLNMTIFDANNTYSFQFGQPVTITDTLEGVKFTGFIQKPVETKIAANNAKWHTLSCMDNHFLADAIASYDQFSNEYGGIIAAFLASKYLSARGVTANYALRRDVAQSDFAQGTLSGTVATTNNGGDLELALAGVPISFVVNPANSPSNISSHNGTQTGNYITCNAMKAIAFSASCTIPGSSSNFLYVSIMQSVAHVINTNDQLQYDVWISKASKKIMAAIDFTCMDGTTFHGIGTVFDQQWMAPDPGTDLTGLADNQWYSRSFNIGFSSLSGKTISFISIAFGGSDTGDYAAYFRRIKIVNGGSTVVDVFNDTTIAFPSTPQVIARGGYTNEIITVVQAYDASCTIASVGADISPSKIYKSSNTSWNITVPASCSTAITGSMDRTGVGNSAVFELLSSNASMPGLVPGMDLTSLSSAFEIYLFNNSNTPTVSPQFYSFNLTVNPSYVASKSDVRYKAKLTADYTGTSTNLTTNNNILYITGYQHKLDFGLPSVTIYGNSGPAYQQVNRSVRLNAANGTDAKLLINDAGSWQNFIASVDFNLSVAGNLQAGFFFRTTNFGNNNDTYAYVVGVFTNLIVFGKGTNSTGSGSFTSIASVGLALSANQWYTLTVDMTGNTLNARINGVLYLNAVTDGTYSASGGIGLRAYNNTGGNADVFFRNFGVVASLSGTYVTPAIDIHNAGSVLAAFTRTQAAGDLAESTLKTEISLNNGSTWADCAGVQAATQSSTAFIYDAETIPGLAPGTNVSSITQVKLRLTLAISSAAAHLETQGTIFYVISSYSSTGQRITPLLYLSSAGRAGSTLASFNAIQPAGTSVALATSTDGVSYTTVTSGGQIAGITAQPLATLDTFDANSASNYTSTNRTGGSQGVWVQDVLNSRLTVSGGANAQLLYGAISCKDTDIILDLDQADCAGLVWRWTDASNFYELDIFDGSSNAGSTNALKLYKIVANTKTQLGSTATVTLTRNTKYRVRVTMIGAAITASVDGVTAISLTDSSLAGPGQVGISEVSGNGRFYNFRIQPLGDDLSSKKAYLKATLTTTDPTQTPQITNLTLAALSPSIGLGSLVSTADYRKTYLSANFDDLAKRSTSYYWDIDQNLGFIFSDRVATPAPWILQSNDQLLLLDGPLTVSKESALYRNRHTVKGVTDAPDGIVSIDNTNLAGTITQKQFAAIMGRSTAVQVVLNLPSTVATVSGDVGDLDVLRCAQIAVDINVSAMSGTTPTIQFFVDRKDANGLYFNLWASNMISAAGQTSTTIGSFALIKQSLGGIVKLRYVLTGTSPSVTFSVSVIGRLTVQSAGLGVVEVVEDVSSQNMNTVTATAYCLSQLQRYGTIGRTLTFKTRRSNPSLGIGQYLPVFIPEHNLNDASMLITQIDTSQKIVADGSGGVTQEYRQSVTTTENANTQSIWKLLASNLN